MLKYSKITVCLDKSYQFVSFLDISFLPKRAQNTEIGNGPVQIFYFLVFLGTMEIIQMTELDGIWVWATLEIENIYLINIFFITTKNVTKYKHYRLVITYLSSYLLYQPCILIFK